MVSSSYNKNKPQTLAASSRAQPKVYKVKPIHFRELVQKLTGAPPELELRPQPQPQPQPRRNSLKSVAPPPLPLHHQHHHQLHFVQNQGISQSQGQIVAAAEPVDQKPLFGGFDSSTELTLSPNFQAWFTFAMLSPGPATVSQMDQRAVV